MTPGSILVTGGAGFIGSSLAVSFRRAFPDARVVAFDNLRRRGSELNLDRLRSAGVAFVHGDVRVASDLHAAGAGIDTLVDCSAEPSVLAGFDDSPAYVIDTNLTGLVNCLELARRQNAVLVFLSTSRVYPIRALSSLRYRRDATRFVLLEDQLLPGASAQGVAEEFPLNGARTLYGATKLAGELLLSEYVDMYGLRAVVDRCGVVAGPWQMGKVEQGVFTLWMLAHVLGWPLKYIGYGGTGHQLRDVLHIDDLAELIRLQLTAEAGLSGEILNVGGGTFASASLMELTDLCVAITGRQVPVSSIAETRVGDVPIYVSDARRVQQQFNWRPTKSVEALMRDIHRWVTMHEQALRRVLT